MSTDTEKLLEERGRSHGEYSEHAAATQGIMDVLMSHRNWPHLPPMVRESLHMFAHKMGRVVTGDPCHPDHYDDIAGYAKLISQRMPIIRGQYLQRLLRAAADRPGTPEDGGHHERDNGPLEYPLPHLISVWYNRGLSYGGRDWVKGVDYERVEIRSNHHYLIGPSEEMLQFLERMRSPNRQEI